MSDRRLAATKEINRLLERIRELEAELNGANMVFYRDTIESQKQHIAELEDFLLRVMRWLDVGVSGLEAKAFCDEAENLLRQRQEQERRRSC